MRICGTERNPLIWWPRGPCPSASRKVYFSHRLRFEWRAWQMEGWPRLGRGLSDVIGCRRIGRGGSTEAHMPLTSQPLPDTMTNIQPPASEHLDRPEIALTVFWPIVTPVYRLYSHSPPEGLGPTTLRFPSIREPWMSVLLHRWSGLQVDRDPPDCLSAPPIVQCHFPFLVAARPLSLDTVVPAPSTASRTSYMRDVIILHRLDLSRP